MLQDTYRPVKLTHNLSTIMTACAFDGPVAVEMPHKRYFRHLLRCKASSKENAEDSVILLEPGEARVKALPLDDSFSRREALCRAWNSREHEDHYYGFVFKPINGDDFEKVYDAIEDGGLRLMEDIANLLLSGLNGRFRDVKPVAMVCHKRQVCKTDEDRVWTRPVHFHILLKRTKNWPMAGSY